MVLLKREIRGWENNQTTAPSHALPSSLSEAQSVSDLTCLFHAPDKSGNIYLFKHPIPLNPDGGAGLKFCPLLFPLYGRVLQLSCIARFSSGSAILSRGGHGSRDAGVCRLEQPAFRVVPKD